MRGLYLVTDRGLCLGRPLVDVVEQAVLGGAACVQIREKELSTRDFVAEAERIQALLAPRGVPLIINDRVDVALAVGAAGVHLGQSDLPCEIARRLLGPKAIIGLSVETWDDVERAARQPVDYLGVSPIFATQSTSSLGKPRTLIACARISVPSSTIAIVPNISTEVLKDCHSFGIVRSPHTKPSTVAATTPSAAQMP